MKSFLISTLLAAAIIAIAPAANGAAEVDIRRDATVAAVERVMPAVVNIATQTIVPVRDPFEQMLRDWYDPYHRRSDTSLSLGSGVIIDEEGYVLTNDHVVQRADKIYVNWNTNVYEAKLVGGNRRSDVALLKIEPINGEKFTAATFAQEDDLMLGETVLSLGNPFGLGGSVSRGILSSKSRLAPKENQPLDIGNWLQTDASINPGNSGGALINLKGELIGVNVAVLAQAQGIGFAIPIKRVTEALSEIFTPEASKLWFGARVKPGTSPLQVTSVQPDSPAGKAGFKPGDKILQLNGVAPGGFIDFNKSLVSNGTNPVKVVVGRNNDRLTLTPKLVPEPDFFNSELIQKKLGVMLQELTPEISARLNLRLADGFIVSAVERDGPAANILQPGMIITGMDGQVPATIIEVAKLLYPKKRGDKVRMDVIVQQRQGAFISAKQGVATVTVR